MNSNPALGLLGFWMMLQLIATLALLVGGIYVLYCFNRAAAGLDRMANAMEDWVALQHSQTPPRPPAPQTLSSQAPAPPVPTSLEYSQPASSAQHPAPGAPSSTQPEYSRPDESPRA